MKPAAPAPSATFGRLSVAVYRNRAQLGLAAARDCAAWLRSVIALRGAARIVLAGTPSQREFLAALATPRIRRSVDWSRVTVFQLQEFVGVPSHAPQSCAHALRAPLLDLVPPQQLHCLEGDLPDLAVACSRFAALLDMAPLDFAALGIGENGHLAFNDPAVADFRDPVRVKPVTLDATCRQQQVHDGCFADLAAVPRHGLTLTLPAIQGIARLSILVAGSRRAPAVRATLQGAITTACPASLLRLHPCARLYLDTPAAALAISGETRDGPRRRRPS